MLDRAIVLDKSILLRRSFDAFPDHAARHEWVEVVITDEIRSSFDMFK
jgi:hypothetical protein